MTRTARREGTYEFKREAAALLRDSGRRLTQVAAELGLEPQGCGADAAWPTERDGQRP